MSHIIILTPPANLFYFFILLSLAEDDSPAADQPDAQTIEETDRKAIDAISHTQTNDT
jgi:hypothetical protein